MYTALVKFPQTIPATNWRRCGSWKDTLKTDLTLLQKAPQAMKVTTLMPLSCSGILNILGVEFHDSEYKWTTLKKVEGCEYAWESSDGHMIDILHIRAPFQHDTLVKILELFVSAGIKLEMRYDAVVHFFE